MSVEVSDFYEDGISHCCSARILTPDVCGACYEHCEPVFEDTDDNV